MYLWRPGRLMGDGVEYSEAQTSAAGLQTLDGTGWSTNARCCSLSLCLAGEGNTVLTPGKVDTSWAGKRETLSLSFTYHAGTMIHTTSSEPGL